jgi:Mg-chelatase subunit ChlD
LQEDLIKNNLLGYKAGGNTNYLDAMRKIGEILADNPPNYTPVVLFMTDGQMSDDGATSILNGLMEAYHDTSGLTLHTIVVGTQGEENIMQQLAQVGKGKMHRSGMSLTELKQVYASLAGVLEQN